MSPHNHHFFSYLFHSALEEFKQKEMTEKEKRDRQILIERELRRQQIEEKKQKAQEERSMKIGTMHR